MAASLTIVQTLIRSSDEDLQYSRQATFIPNVLVYQLQCCSPPLQEPTIVLAQLFLIYFSIPFIILINKVLKWTAWGKLNKKGT